MIANDLQPGRSGWNPTYEYSYFAALRLELTPEKSSNAGRLDLALHFNHNIYLF